MQNSLEFYSNKSIKSSSGNTLRPFEVQDYTWAGSRKKKINKKNHQTLTKILHLVAPWGLVKCKVTHGRRAGSSQTPPRRKVDSTKPSLKVPYYTPFLKPLRLTKEYNFRNSTLMKILLTLQTGKVWQSGSPPETRFGLVRVAAAAAKEEQRSLTFSALNSF